MRPWCPLFLIQNNTTLCNPFSIHYFLAYITQTTVIGSRTATRNRLQIWRIGSWLAYAHSTQGVYCGSLHNTSCTGWSRPERFGCSRCTVRDMPMTSSGYLVGGDVNKRFINSTRYRNSQPKNRSLLRACAQQSWRDARRRFLYSLIHTYQPTNIQCRPTNMHAFAKSASELHARWRPMPCWQSATIAIDPACWCEPVCPSGTILWCHQSILYAWSSSFVFSVHHPEHHNLHQSVVIHPADVAE